jgi:predicted oxidoreductase (fatty acid repression mutant protein)
MRYLSGQGTNKPVEAHPHEFREWEPQIKALIEREKKAKEETIDYFKEKYGAVLVMDEKGDVKIFEKEPKEKK